jgi:hypothetical protein
MNGSESPLSDEKGIAFGGCEPTVAWGSGLNQPTGRPGQRTTISARAPRGQMRQSTRDQIAEQSEEPRFPAIVRMCRVQKTVEYLAAIDHGKVGVAELHVACIVPRG